MIFLNFVWNWINQTFHRMNIQYTTWINNINFVIIFVADVSIFLVEITLTLKWSKNSSQYLSLSPSRIGPKEEKLKYQANKQSTFIMTAKSGGRSDRILTLWKSHRLSAHHDAALKKAPKYRATVEKWREVSARKRKQRTNVSWFVSRQMVRCRTKKEKINKLTKNID